MTGGEQLKQVEKKAMIGEWKRVTIGVEKRVMTGEWKRE